MTRFTRFLGIYLVKPAVDFLGNIIFYCCLGYLKIICQNQMVLSMFFEIHEVIKVTSAGLAQLSKRVGLIT